MPAENLSPLHLHPSHWIGPARRALPATVRLAFPIVVIQVGVMLTGVVDTIMLGHLSPAALAAGAIGHLYFFLYAVFGMGLLMVLDPLVAQAVGAGDRPSVARNVQRGLVLAIGVSAVGAVGLCAAGPVLRAAQQPPEVVQLATGYVLRLAPGIAPFFVFIVFRQTLQALGRVRPVVITIVAANVVNVLLNWVLIYGGLGIPPMGVDGAAWATTASRWFMVLLVAVLAWPALRPYLHPMLPDTLRLVPLGRMLRLGLPIGCQALLEYGAFALVALLMGWLGVHEVAGHQVAINLASLSFMVPFGISAAAAVLVGQAIGRGDAAGARGAALAALLCGIGFMTTTAFLFLTLDRPLARLFTADDPVLAVAVRLIPIAGVFQVFDGAQVVASGILRGLGDTRVPMLVNLLGYWIVGLPVSIYLGLVAGGGPVGLWWGLVIGLAIVAAVLFVRVILSLARSRTRLDIDGELRSPVAAGEVGCSTRALAPPASRRASSNSPLQGS